MLLVGLPAFGLYALKGSERVPGAVIPFRHLLGALAVLGIALSALALIVLAASMSGVAPGDVDKASIDAVLTETSIGSAWQVRIVALLAIVWLSVIGWRRLKLGLVFASTMGAVALGSLAWISHGASSEGATGWIHLVNNIVHLLAAGVWIGALLSLGLLLFRRTSAMSGEHVVLSHRTLEGFSTVGTVVIALIVVSGLVNSWILIGPAGFPALFTTLYGQLLLTKLALFVAMLGLAWTNRSRLTPALATALRADDHKSAVQALRRSLMLETVVAVVILLLVAWLGLLAPPGSDT